MLRRSASRRKRSLFSSIKAKVLIAAAAVTAVAAGIAKISDISKASDYVLTRAYEDLFSLGMAVDPIAGSIVKRLIVEYASAVCVASWEVTPRLPQIGTHALIVWVNQQPGDVEDIDCSTDTSTSGKLAYVFVRDHGAYRLIGNLGNDDAPKSEIARHGQWLTEVVGHSWLQMTVFVIRKERLVPVESSDGEPWRFRRRVVEPVAISSGDALIVQAMGGLFEFHAEPNGVARVTRLDLRSFSISNNSVYIEIDYEDQRYLKSIKVGAIAIHCDSDCDNVQFNVRRNDVFFTNGECIFDDESFERIAPAKAQLPERWKVRQTSTTPILFCFRDTDDERSGPETKIEFLMER